MFYKPHTRRVFLKAAGCSLFTACSGGVPLFLPRLVGAARADSATDHRHTLVCIFQRGGMDGLAAVAPWDDPGLQELRPRLAMGRNGNEAERLLPLHDSRFGLHPAFASLQQLYDDGLLAVVHGMGSPNPTRSHFEAQDYMEIGTPYRKSTPSGWLNRVLQLTAEPDQPMRAVAHTANLPRSLSGSEPALAVSDLRELRLGGGTENQDERTARALASLYRDSDDRRLQLAGADGFQAMQTLQRLDVVGYRPAVEYPDHKLGRALRQTAFLIKSRVGLEVAFCEQDGWDTHVHQGRERGYFATRARNLAAAISAFWQDLGKYRDQVVVLTMTEFGRTVHQNGSGGTDHGRGSCLFVLGAGVDGGKVHGRVPRLRRDELEDERDLPVTTDFRGVFAAVAAGHLGVDDVATLFPGYEGPLCPVMRG